MERLARCDAFPQGIINMTMTMSTKVSYVYFCESSDRPAMRAVHKLRSRSINVSLEETLIEGVDMKGRLIRMEYRTIMSMNTPLGQPRTMVEVMEPA
jgi:hypothetical protein